MKEEMKLNKGSHKLKSLQPQDYQQTSRSSTSSQLRKNHPEKGEWTRDQQ